MKDLAFVMHTYILDSVLNALKALSPLIFLQLCEVGAIIIFISEIIKLIHREITSRSRLNITGKR